MYFLEDTTGYPFTWTITQRTELSGRKNSDGLWESQVSEYELKGKPESGSISKRFATVGKAKKWVAKYQRKNPAVEIEYAKINNEIIRLRLRERRILEFLSEEKDLRIDAENLGGSYSVIDTIAKRLEKGLELRNVRNRIKTLTKKLVRSSCAL